MCAPGCGDGVVDVALGEECDTTDVCCDEHCRYATLCHAMPCHAMLYCAVLCYAMLYAMLCHARLVPGSLCCGGECCTGGGQPRPTTYACAAGDGYCLGGQCATETPFCALASGVVSDAVTCKPAASSPCRPLT